MLNVPKDGNDVTKLINLLDIHVIYLDYLIKHKKTFTKRLFAHSKTMTCVIAFEKHAKINLNLT